MSKRMLIDTTHPEETRVVVLTGNRLEEFDHETSRRRQLKSNIYLAKVTRVEPSLQAAFVDYGGDRHGFLPFSEIHPDYYRIPIADRQALIAEEAELAKQAEAEGNGEDDDGGLEAADDEGDSDGEAPASAAADAPQPPAEYSESDEDDGAPSEADSAEDGASEVEAAEDESTGDEGAEDEPQDDDRVDAKAPRVDTLGGDEAEDAARRRARLMRRYKIQEVIKRRQVILVQVAKESRGTKGAALTTYLSLAGRYCVLMPNTAKGGGISRKIASATDRRRLKQVMSDMEIPEGMAVIVRTAGSRRSKAEIRRDFQYLLRLWDEIRETTLQSTAPCLIYEEANLIKRAIRDLYDRDMSDIVVEGDEGYKEARAFMKSLMPSHARKVQAYKDPTVPLFNRYQVESQLDAMHSPTVRLSSGGYVVINPTEALVAIDVNSGKATKERHIEETAVKTNLEAAEEIARQLRLRDLAGLIVIDFIDMEENRHIREVERRLKDAMRIDRARIQVGRISPFGLLELSRQRLRPSLLESSSEICPTCGGTGTVRSVESSALHVLRALEEEGIRRSGGAISVSVPTDIALYMLNQKRERVLEIEQRYGFSIRINRDDGLLAPNYTFARVDGEAAPQGEAVKRAVEATVAETDGEAADGEDGRKRRRRRRPRRKGDDTSVAATAAEAAEEPVEAEDVEEPAEAEDAAAAAEDDEDSADRKTRRRRGRRGGRRRTRQRRDETGEASEAAAGAPDEIEADEIEANDLDDEPVALEAAQEPEDAEPESEIAAEAPAAASPAEPVTLDYADEEEPAAESPGGNGQEGPASEVFDPVLDDGDAGSAPDAPPPAVAAPAPDAAAEQPDPKPKRRGWWNRFV